MLKTVFGLMMLMFFIFSPAQALERPDVEFKIFQFPPNMIPRIDGNTDDWNMVPDSYAIETDQINQIVDIIGAALKQLD